MPTTVINIKNAPSGWKFDPLYTYIGRRCHWGNPFAIKRESDRDLVIEKYIDWIDTQRSHNESEFRAKLQLDIKDHILVCYCKPKACHGDILARMADAIFEDAE